VYYGDVYSFSGTAGQSVTINLTSSLFNTHLVLVSPSGSTAATFDSFTQGTGLNSSISFALTQTGTWQIDVASSFPYATGNYALTVSATGPPSTPSANFSFSPAAPSAGQAVSFSDTSAGSPTSWSWVFGDPASGSANTSSLQNPSHVFRSGGTYTVTLTAANPSGSNAVSKSIVVATTPVQCSRCTRVVPFRPPR
jgi:PKD repeat protein